MFQKLPLQHTHNISMRHSVSTALTTCGNESVEIMMTTMPIFIAHNSINLMLSALKEGKGGERKKKVIRIKEKDT